jgi:hypothetical protein
MSSAEIDSVLTGIIILLLIIVVWKWMKGKSMYRNTNNMSLACGCKNGLCRCRGRIRKPKSHICCTCNQNKSRCLCGITRGDSGMGMHIDKENSYVRDAARNNGIKEAMANSCATTCEVPDIGTPGFQPKIVSDTGDFSGDTIQQLSLDPEIYNSQKAYIGGFGFSGLPTGSSHETLLSETGRSYGTANFVGLTQRKFCKARQLATPAPDARQVPTETEQEWCHINMDELI